MSLLRSLFGRITLGSILEELEKRGADGATLLRVKSNLDTKNLKLAERFLIVDSDSVCFTDLAVPYKILEGHVIDLADL